MFESHFGLRENPFVAGHHARFVYPSPEHQEALAHLRFGIENREPFVLITGEVGTGKTTALYDALEQLRSSVTVALINNSALTRSELLEEIALRFGVGLTPPVTKPQVTLHLERHLLSLKARGERAILLLDEAQNLERDLLEEIRLLSNLEAGGEKLVQIVLIGQPELEERLARPELRQLRQRIAVHYRLSPLGPDDTMRYIHHRITVAGGYAPAIFKEDTCAEVYRLTHGIPREINQVCAQAMLNAYVEDARQVRPHHVTAIEHEGEFRSVLEGGVLTEESIERDETSGPAPRIEAVPPMRAVPPLEPVRGDGLTSRTEPPPARVAPPMPEIPARQPEPPAAVPSAPGPGKPGEASTWEAWVQSLAERHGIEPPPGFAPVTPIAGAANPRESESAPRRDTESERPRMEPPATEPTEPALRPVPPPSESPLRPVPPPSESTLRPVPPIPREEPITPVRASSPPPSRDEPPAPVHAGTPPPPIEFPQPRAQAEPAAPRPTAVPPAPTPDEEPARPAYRPIMSSRRLEEEERAAKGGNRNALLGVMVGLLVVAMIVVGWILFRRFGGETAATGAGATQETTTPAEEGGTPPATGTTAPTAEGGETGAPATGTTTGPAAGPSATSVPTRESTIPARPAPTPTQATQAPTRATPAPTQPTTAPTRASRTTARATQAPAQPAPAPSVYGISVGTFLDRQRAEAERERLASSTQLPGRVTTVMQDGAEMYQVVLGRFTARPEAERSAGDLIQRGLVDEARVVRQSGSR